MAIKKSDFHYNRINYWWKVNKSLRREMKDYKRSIKLKKV